MVMTNFYPASPGPAASRGGGGQRGGGGGNNNPFYKYVLEEVLPAIAEKYRIAAGRENQAVAGMSMGANQALDLFLGHFDRFSSVGVFCASSYNQLESANAAWLADAKGTNAKTGVIWIGCGRQDTQHFSGSERVAQVLEAHQITHTWVPTDGMHNYAIWRNHLEAFLPLLFQSGGKGP